MKNANLNDAKAAKDKNANLNDAKAAKDDEFYTQYKDIENEISQYTDDLKGKTIYLNCDDPTFSQFWQYFVDNFDAFNIKHLIATYYAPLKSDGFFDWDHEPSYRYDFDGINTTKTLLKKRGSFDSEECLSILRDEADVVISNPPFSLWRHYLQTIMDSGKDFIILGSNMVPTVRYPFECIYHNKMFVNTHHLIMKFNRIKKDAACVLVSWYSSFDHTTTHTFTSELLYNPDDYTMYDNYPAIRCASNKLIPMDYAGLMAVPITFLKHYNPEEFELVDLLAARMIINKHSKNRGINTQHLNGERTFAMLIIRNRKFEPQQDYYAVTTQQDDHTHLFELRG